MSGWVKLDDDFFLNPKVQAAGPEAAYMWVVSIAWSAGRGTDGAIPTHMVPLIAAMSGVANSELAINRLLDAGLWESPDPDGAPGYQVHDYLEKQTPAAEREAAKEGARERQRKSRAKRAPKPLELVDGHTPVTRDSHRESQRSSFAEVEVETEVDNNDSRTPATKRYKRLLSTVAWSSARTTPGVRSQSGYQRAIVEGADESGLADQLHALLHAHPDAEIDWLVDEHLGRPHPRAPYVPPDPKEVMRAHRGGAA